MCNNCKKRSTCKKICEEVEKNHLKFGHSLKSNYFIKFVDPFVIEDIHYSNDYPKYSKIRFHKAHYLYLNKSLKKISKNYRLSLMYYYGVMDGERWSQTKIAKILHVSQNTVKYYLKKARIAMKINILQYMKK